MPAPAHSPLPWVCDYSHVFRKSGGLIASVQTPRDAAHIVLCVNSHDALVAALNEIMAECLVQATPETNGYMPLSFAIIHGTAKSALATLNA